MESESDDRAFSAKVRLLAPVSAEELKQELLQREQAESYEGTERYYQNVLVTAWAKKDPKAALDHSLRRSASVETEYGKSWLACNAWIEQAPAEALDWLSVIAPEDRRRVAMDAPFLAIKGALANQDDEAVSRFLSASDGTEWFEILPMDVEDIEQSLDEEGRQEFRKILEAHQGK